MAYFRSAVRGISWMALLRGSMRGMTLVKVIILARILTPSQFGVYGIALLVLGFLEILTETGINVVLIQEEGKTDKYISTAWIVSIFRGILISLIILALAPFIATFFDSPKAFNLIRFASLIPLVRGFINPSIVKFQKELQFNKEFWFRSPLFLIDAIFAILLGILTRSEYSLIWGMLAAAVMEVTVSFFIVKPTPKIEFEIEKVKRVIGRGKWITFAGIFEYFFQHLDDIVVGKLLGTAPLGLYQQAYRVSTLPISEVGEVFNKVTFPTYTKISEDKERLKKAFLKVTSIISLLVIPFGLFLFFFAKEVVLILLGDKWLEAAGALKVLAAFGIIKAISNSAYSLFLSVKRQEIITLITLVGILGLAIPLVPLINKFGIVGAGYATIIGALVGIPIGIYFLFRVFKN